MRVLFLRNVNNEDSSCAELRGLLEESGVVLEQLFSAAELEQRLTSPANGGWAHIVGLSDETASVVADRAMRFPQKLPVVVARAPHILQNFLETLSQAERNFLITLVDLENPAAQIRLGAKVRVVRQWISAVYCSLFPPHVVLTSEERDGLESLFVLRPFLDGVKRGRPIEPAGTQARLKRLLASRGLKPQAQIRKANFAALWHTCVGTFDADPRWVLRLCLAGDIRSAERKLCDVLGARDIKEALRTPSDEAIRRSFRFIFEDPTMISEQPMLMDPVCISGWRALLRSDQSNPRGDPHAPVVERQLAAVLVHRWSLTVRSVCAEHFFLGDGLQDAQQDVWELLLRKLAKHQYMDAADSHFKLTLSDEAIGKEIIRIARGKTANLIRSRRRIQSRQIHLDVDAVYPAGNEDPLADLERDEHQRIIIHGLSTISPEMSEIMREKFWEGQTSREIAKRHGIREQRLSERIADTLKILRTELSGARLI